MSAIAAGATKRSKHRFRREVSSNDVRVVRFKDNQFLFLSPDRRFANRVRFVDVESNPRAGSELSGS